MTRTRVVYCDLCNRKSMPVQDKDWHDGMEHEYHQEPESPEPPETRPETDIVLSVSAKRWNRYACDGRVNQRYPFERVDLCLVCTTDLLKRAVGINDGD